MAKHKNQPLDEKVSFEKMVDSVPVESTGNCSENSAAAQIEDAALKTSMRAFADELLPYLKIKGKVASYGTTESVYLELKKLYQDFNLVMEARTRTASSEIFKKKQKHGKKLTKKELTPLMLCPLMGIDCYGISFFRKDCEVRFGKVQNETP